MTNFPALRVPHLSKSLRILIASVIAMAFTGVVTAQAPQSEAAQKKASISVFHAIPEGYGADVVDIYADGGRIMNNVKSGELKSMRVRPGTYDIEIYVNGERPKVDEPILEIDRVTFLSGTCSTVTANLDEVGTPTTNVFANCVARNPVGEGRITVRHIAAAPAVDVLAGGNVIFGNLTNGSAATKRLPASTYAVTVNLANSVDRVLGPANVNITRPFNTIVYAWGSAAEGTLALKVQRVPINR